MVIWTLVAEEGDKNDISTPLIVTAHNHQGSSPAQKKRSARGGGHIRTRGKNKNRASRGSHTSGQSPRTKIVQVEAGIHPDMKGAEGKMGREESNMSARLKRNGLCKHPVIVETGIHPDRQQGKNGDQKQKLCQVEEDIHPDIKGRRRGKMWARLQDGLCIHPVIRKAQR